MDALEARTLLAGSDDTESPVDLPASVLPKLTIDDLRDGRAIQVGTLKKGVVHLDWNGTLGRDGDEIFGEADHTWTRKYWYSPLGLEQYLDLVRRAVETRHRTRGDVELTDYDDDGAYVALRFRINTVEKNLGKAYALSAKSRRRSRKRPSRQQTKSGNASLRWLPVFPGGAQRHSMRWLTPRKQRVRLMTRAEHWRSCAAGCSHPFRDSS
jgi:hypothetical protein